MQKKLSAMLASAAIFSTTVAGCTSVGANQRPASFVQSAPVAMDHVEKALVERNFDLALVSAEDLTAAEPNNADYRALLGRTYLANGRYISARMAFTDAMTLGNRDVRTIVSLALSQIGLGDVEAAHELLLAHIDHLPAADYGLAMTLTGDAQEGVRALMEAVKQPDATAQTRQNLAYALALGGQWGQARLVAGQDLTVKEAERRIGEWSQVAQGSSPSQRVAALTGVAPRGDDGGMPVRLALNANDAPIQVASVPEALAAQVAQKVAPETRNAAPVAVSVLAPVPIPILVSVATPVEAVSARSSAVNLTDARAVSPSAPIQVVPIAPTVIAKLPQPPVVEAAAPAPVATASVTPDSIAAVMGFEAALSPEAPLSQKAALVADKSIREAARASFQRASANDAETLAGRAGMSRMTSRTVTASLSSTPMTFAPVADAKSSDWVVQLGAYNSESVAKEKWRVMSRGGTPLAGYPAIHSKLAIKGRMFHRVAVRGFSDRVSANALCNRLNTTGQACFVRRDDSEQARVARTQAVAKPTVTATYRPVAAGNALLASRR